MKVNVSFLTDIFDEKVHQITIYGDDQKDLIMCVKALQSDYVLTNVFYNRNDKKDV